MNKFMYFVDGMVSEMEDKTDSRESEERDPVIASQPIEVELDQPCISCGQKGVVNIISNLDLPYLGAAMQTTYICRTCGFKHSDMIALENKGPLRREAAIEKVEDLNLRVVRSNSGTIRIPEIGVEIEPGMASESFISNAEGILDRVEEVVRVLMRDAELDVHEKCSALLSELGKMKVGEKPFHLIVEDPYGNSAILGEKVKITGLTEEEASRLKKGEMTFDMSPLKSEGTGEDWGAGERGSVQ